MASRSFRVEGLDCAEEVQALRAALLPLLADGEELAFDILRGRMEVAADPERVSTDSLLEAVARTGLRAVPWRDEPPAGGGTGFFARHGRAALSAAGLLLLLLALLLHLLARESGGLAGAEPLLTRLLYTLSILLSARYVLPKAWAALRRARPDMNLLMTVAVGGAVVIGEWFEAATVAWLFSVALLLESFSVGRARKAIEKLLQTAPSVVRLREADGTEVLAEPREVAVGTRFFVRPGDRIPLDGSVVAGESAVDQAPITGESVPVPKAPGDEVFAGTANGEGTLEIESTRPADRTTLANIIRLVTEAHSRRAPAERWVERFAARYTPSVILLALLVFLVPPLALRGSWAVWFYRSLVLLVIACPCALVISTPVSIVAGLASAARQGVLVKGGAYLEAPAHLRAIALDKTGTLTRGRPQVVGIVPLNGHSPEELLERAAALERDSSHPLAEAIREAAAARGVAGPPAEDFRILPGRGARGRIAGREYWLGSRRYLAERDRETPEVRDRIEALTDARHTLVAVGTEDHVCGLITMADRPRPEAEAALRALREAGVRHLVMLTGDNDATARAVGEEVGVTEIRAELLPEDKVLAVEDLVRKHGRVGMVGDGVNDAPAMARASLAIAMGAAGSDAAIETADVALMSDNLARLPWLIRHSRRTLRVIRQNISLALGVKAAFVVFTFAGFASLWAAITADMGASLVVTMNGLRLLHPGRFRIPPRNVPRPPRVRTPEPGRGWAPAGTNEETPG